jgi:hypothetical protein
MATVFWDRRGVLMVEFVQQGTTINVRNVLLNTKKNYVGAFRTKVKE